MLLAHRPVLVWTLAAYPQVMVQAPPLAPAQPPGHCLVLAPAVEELGSLQCQLARGAQQHPPAGLALALAQVVQW